MLSALARAIERVFDLVEVVFVRLVQASGCGVLLLFIAGVLGAYVQAILTCAAEGRGFLLVLGAILPPIGIINGIRIWIGWW